MATPDQDPDTGSAPGSTPSISLGSNLLRPQRRGARRWLVIVSLIAHAAAIGAYVVVGMMRIERLTPDKGRISISMGHQIDPGSGPTPGSKPKPPKPEQPPQVKTVKPKVIVQPVDQSHISLEQSPSTANDTDDSTGDTDDTGGGGGGGGDPCIGPDCKTGGGDPCVGANCKTGGGDTKPIVEQVENIPPTVIQSLRLSGDTQIHPSEVALNAMRRDGKTKVLGIVKLCLDTSGRINKVSVLKSTGYPDYDLGLVRGVRTWTYRPHRVNNTPVPVCSTVAFAYLIKGN